MSGTVAAVILAAGESRRFGGAKQLALLDGRSLLEHVLLRAADAGLDPIVAVVPVWLTRPRDWTDARLRWVRNPHPGRGMSHSLQLGFAALPPACEAAVILLGDQPTMPPERIAAVVAGRGERPIVATHVGGRPAPPVLVERSHFAVIGQAVGDAGLRDLLAAHPEWVVAITVPGHVPDIDTPADLDGLSSLDGR
ncbi:MAG: nucleotidyltransferase family protein [Chloroflexota bacterium]